MVLLQVAAMLLLPATLGGSATRSLRLAPSHFINQALTAYFPAMMGFDLLWLGGAGLWLALEGLPAAKLGTVVGGYGLGLAVAMLFVLISAAQIWIHVGVAPRLRSIAGNVEPLGAGDVVQVDPSGNLRAERRDVDQRAALREAGLSSALYAVLTGLVVALLILIMVASGAFSDGTLLLKQLLVVGLWMSLGVIAVDLFMDVWPPTATPTRLRRAYLYYFRVFEYSLNVAVLLALATVLLLAPVAYFFGWAPLPVVSFPAWIATCIAFATWWNRRLYPAGRVASTLPLPAARNVYSAKNPTWAYFFTGIHVVMILCLAAGIVSLN